MKIVKRFVFSCLLICALSIPASTFATSGNTYSNQNFFQSVFDFLFSGDKGAQYWGNKSSNENDWWEKSYGSNNWDDWKKDKDDKDWGNWDGCLKHENRCIESIDIWRDWYCGKEDKNHKHDYAWANDKGDSWNKWKWW